MDRLGSIVSRAGESFLRVYLERMRAFDDHKEGVLVEQIMRHLWDGDFFGEARAADVHAQHIRSKVESDPQNPHYVLTVRGAGYKFADLQR